MPIYTILCSTSTCYSLTVEAPDAEAVRAFYEGCDGDEFDVTAQNGGWQLDEIVEELDEIHAKYCRIVLDSEGNEIAPAKEEADVE